MDPLINTVLIFLVTTLLTTMLIKRIKNKPESQLPPGPKGLPILGSLHKLNPEKPHRSFLDLNEKYGQNGLFSLQMGNVYTVVLTNHVTVKEAFSKDVFMGRAPLYLTHGIANGYGIIASEGDLWKDQRKSMAVWMRILGAARGSQNRPQLFSKLDTLADLLETEIDDVMKKEKDIDLSHVIINVMAFMAHDISYGLSFQKDDPVWKWLINIQEDGVKAMGVAAVVNFLPFLRFVFPSIKRTMAVITNGQAQTHRFIDSFINIRKKYLKETKGLQFDVDEKMIDREMECNFYTTEEANKDDKFTFYASSLTIHQSDCILDQYLEEQLKRKEANDIDGLNRLSDVQLKYFLCDVFGASLDTSGNTLSWFIFMMALYPEEQEKVRQEIHSVCGNVKPNMDHMQSLPYIKATLNETQRFRPIVPLGVPHGTAQDTTLAGYFIPKGTMIMPFQWGIHHDPKVWGDPEVFKPSRFIGSDGNVLQPPSFIPFQIGKRMCPGDELSRMVLFILASRLISCYQFELTDKPDNTEGIFGLTLSPPKYRLKMKRLLDWS